MHDDAEKMMHERKILAFLYVGRRRGWYDSAVRNSRRCRSASRWGGHRSNNIIPSNNLPVVPLRKLNFVVHL